MNLKSSRMSGNGYASILVAVLLILTTTSTLPQSTSWVLQFGGTKNEVSSNQIAVDYDGNAIISSSFEGTVTIGNTVLTARAKDVFVAKITPNGYVVWVCHISGSGDEAVMPNQVAIDRNNNMHLIFYSSSKTVTIGSKEVVMESADDARPRIVKISATGNYDWGLYDVNGTQNGFGNIPYGWTQLACDDDNRLIVTSKMYTGIAEIKRYTTGGSLSWSATTQPANMGHHPRYLNIGADANGNVYSTMTYVGPTKIFNQTFDGTNGTNDVVIIKQDSLGNLLWIRDIKSPFEESVSQMKIYSDSLVIYGAISGFDQSDSSSSIRIGDVTFKIRNDWNGFAASLKLDGTPLQFRPLAVNFGLGVSGGNDVDVSELEGTLKVASPGAGVWISSQAAYGLYYKGMTYSLSDVCGGNYYMGNFSDTVMLDNGRYLLVSKGEKDVFLAFQRPASKYVPDRAGLREPLNSALNLDIPTVLEWWWVGCSTGHQLQVSSDSAMTQIVHDSLVTSGTKDTLTNLSHSTTYYWRVRAVTADTFGIWSEVRSFTTVKAQPADVVLEYPSNRSQGVVKTNTLRWSSSKRATNYIVDVATDSAFAEKLFNGKLVNGTSLDVVLESNKTYYWRVRAGNAAGTSPWSQVWMFTTRPDRPAAALLLSPTDRSANEVVNTHFVWQSQGTVMNYSLQVARDSMFQFKEVDINVMETAWRDTLEANTTYFWRVRASTPFESGDWSLPWSFTTGTVLSIDETAGTELLQVVYADGSLLIHAHDESLMQQKVEVRIYTLSGERILQSPVQFTSTPMRVVPPPMARGTYMVQIIHNDGSSVASPFVVK